MKIEWVWFDSTYSIPDVFGCRLGTLSDIIKNEMEWIQSLTQLNGLTQPLMFLVMDSVLYLANNEIEIG